MGHKVSVLGPLLDVSILLMSYTQTQEGFRPTNASMQLLGFKSVELYEAKMILEMGTMIEDFKTINLLLTISGGHLIELFCSKTRWEKIVTQVLSKNLFSTFQSLCNS